MQNDAYIINQCTSHFYLILNSSYGRICKWTRFPIRLVVIRLKMQLLITPLQCTLGPQKFNCHFWLDVHQWFQFYQYLNGFFIYDSTTLIEQKFKNRSFSSNNNQIQLILS